LQIEYEASYMQAVAGNMHTHTHSAP